MRNPTTKHLVAVLFAALCILAGCVSFSGGAVSPLFAANFREGSSFPNLDPFQNVLLIDVSTVVDRLDTPPTLKVSIDGTQVYTQTVTTSGRIELTFPPAAWTPIVGEHEVEITMGDVQRELPFSWNG
jgi:hypothetical protein